MDLSQQVVLPAKAGLVLSNKIPASKREAVFDMYAQKLDVVLTYDDSATFSKSCRDFIKQYVGELARERLSHLDQGGDNLHRKGAALTLRKRSFQALRRLALISKGMDAALLVDSAVVFGPENRSTMVHLTSDALNATRGLLGDLTLQALPAFSTALASDSTPVDSFERTGFCLSALLASGGPAVVQAFGQKDFVITLSRAYARRAASGSEQLLTNAKMYLVDALHTIMQNKLSLIKEDGSAAADLFDILFALFDQPTPSSSHALSSSSTPAQLLLNSSLVAAYESTYCLSDTLASIDTMDNGMRDYVVETLKEQRVFGIQISPSHGSNVSAPVNGHNSSAKGKGKSRAEPEHDTTSLELAISQVLDILPDENPSFVRACLQHSQFSNSVEKVVAALLEDRLPPDLAAKRAAGHSADGPATVEEEEHFPLLQSRRNAFDDDPLDFSKLRIGKSRETADTVLQDRSYLEAVKADILRRVMEQSDDEEDEDAGGRVVAFEEELEDSVAPGSVKVAGDGEETEEVDGEDIEEEQEQHRQPATINIYSLLEQTYLRDAKAFDRDAATRRSKPRAQLRSQTGWTDEQLEGWRIMLERNPRKDKILEKHADPLNVPMIQPPLPQPSSSTATRENVSMRGGRGRGGGGGRGHGAGGGDAREKAWKDKNKARQANHDRKRGHDKKMARGGAP